jgi:hypothetical protein
MCQIHLKTRGCRILEYLRRHVRHSFSWIWLEGTRNGFTELDYREFVRILGIQKSLQNFLVRLQHVDCKISRFLLESMLCAEMFIWDRLRNVFNANVGGFWTNSRCRLTKKKRPGLLIASRLLRRSIVLVGCSFVFWRSCCVCLLRSVRGSSVGWCLTAFQIWVLIVLEVVTHFSSTCNHSQGNFPQNSISVSSLCQQDIVQGNHDQRRDFDR